MDSITTLFKRLKPLIVGLFNDLFQQKGLGSGGGGMQTHDLSGSYHSGTLGIASVPDVLDRNGTRALVGSLALGPGVLIGGVNLPDLKLDHDALGSAYAAHDAASAVDAHGTVGAHNHQTTANGGQLDHGAALTGLGDDDHTQYAAALGSAITRPAKDLDSAINKTWTGNHTFQGALVSRHHRPELNDTYDSGTEDYRWRQLFASELETILLKYKAVLAVDGEIILAKQNGTLEANITAVQTTIDFGQSMTVGDVVYIAGNAKIEYLTVGSVVSGTTYNVTRNVDGSGADAWNQGQAWICFGHDGDMRIHIMGGSANNPRVVLRRQGTAYNLTQDILKLDGTGISILSNNALTNEELRSYRFLKSDGVTLLGALFASANGTWNSMSLTTKQGAGNKSQTALYAEGTALGFIDITSDTGGTEARMGASRTVLGAGLLGGSAESLLAFGGPSGFPSSPDASDLAFRTDYRAFFEWTDVPGGAWRQVGAGSFASSFPSAPAPQTGMRVFRIDFRSYFVYDGSAWRQLAAGEFSGSFPSSPVDDLRVYRADRGLEYFYDSASSSWLTVHEYTASMLEHVLTGTGTTPMVPTRTDYAIYVTRVRSSIYIAAPHDAGNYWNVQWRGYDAARASTTTLIANQSSWAAVAAAATWGSIEAAPTTPAPANRANLSTVGTKVGAPGNIAVSTTYSYRLIG